jgi:uncharacterized protein (TIGR02996 family)
MPGTEQLALWSAIRANPDDDTPRLVYADWLQENGEDERAEFIRVQCQLAAIDDRQENFQQARQLLTRSKRLLNPNRHRWTQPLFGIVQCDLDRESHYEVYKARQWQGGISFTRGFASPSLTVHQAVRVIEAEHTLEPLSRVSLDSYLAVRRVPDLRILARHNTLCVYSLTLHHCDDAVAESLAAAPWLARVESLSLVSGQLGNVGVTALFQDRPTGKLRMLDLRGNLIDTPGAIALAGSPFLSGVTQLHVTNNCIGDIGVIALAESPHLSHVRRISLDGNPIGPKVWQQLRERFGDSLGAW